MADGCAELVFHYRGVFSAAGQVQPSSVLQGQSSCFSRYETTSDFGIFGAYLYPFAIPKLLGIPAYELTNLSIGLADILGNDSAMLEERMMAAKNNVDRFNVLSGFLMNKLATNYNEINYVYAAVHEMINSETVPRVEKLSGKYCLSARQFERNFKALSGFPPKMYHRITRFNKAMAMYGQLGKTLTDIAYECGYYDQSHFIHDFKAFSGYHPGVFFSGHAEGTEYRNV